MTCLSQVRMMLYCVINHVSRKVTLPALIAAGRRTDIVVL